ncbi:ATP-binding protein [Mesonia sp. MT50]|uniref:ATP-binding protein n=1 Tax=Mesonia profundi TaxID=3070998 RepID=A0ABU1A085_9FLAO|nr:ATP-binding protein [Mesonia profundi]MDQ7917115.1 ATP-binding protein [Mesonia profundi]
MAKAQKILLIGGPGTGKSTIINHLDKMGYRCFPEISRKITLTAQKEGTEQLFLSQPLRFSELLLEGRIKQHQEADDLAANYVFIDRGIPDITAYMDFRGDQYPETFENANLKYTYDQVFLLPIWEAIYTSDNERYENLDQAKKIQQQLIKTYTELGYDLIEVPKSSVEKRVEFILTNTQIN